MGEAEAISTAVLAERLGMKRGTFNAKVRRLGGARPGMQLEGWHCVGIEPSPAGGPPRALWRPADPAA